MWLDRIVPFVRMFFTGPPQLPWREIVEEFDVDPSLRQDLLRALESLKKPPVAIEAYWDGDTTGWLVVLSAVVPRPLGNPSAVSLAYIRRGGDIRIFNGQVPPWPESHIAANIGAAIAEQFEVPFYFPSPARPEDECPHWWEKDDAYSCEDCGLPLLQREPCPWKGKCYHCHLEQERQGDPSEPGV